MKKNASFLKSLFSAIAVIACSATTHAQIISTLAGISGSPAYTGDGGAAASSKLYGPYDVKSDVYGNIYIADTYNARIRKVSTSGVITTVAGTGTAGDSGDGGPATAAQLGHPLCIDIDISGNIYIGDRDYPRVRKVSASGTISTIVGDSYAGFTGDGGPATAARITPPWGIAVDRSGNVYIGDMGNYRIRRISASGIITTFAGNGSNGFSGDGGAATAAKLSDPRSLAVDTLGNVYITDYGNTRIRKVSTTGIINTIAGSATAGYSGDGGIATAALLNYPEGLAVSNDGRVFITDRSNFRVRMIDGSGIMSTIAGTGVVGSSGDGGAATNAKITCPVGACFDYAGNFYIADFCDHTIRKITCTSAPVVGAITGVDSLCPGDTTMLSNIIAGGVWSSMNPTIASIEPNGQVTALSTGTTTIRYIYTNVCGADTALLAMHITSSACATTGTTALKLAAPSLVVYPNPVSSNCSINFSTPVTREAHLTICNLLGQTLREVTTTTNKETTIEIQLPTGIYYIIGTAGDTKLVQKIEVVE